MRIASVASAFPKYYFKQEVIVEALKKEWRKQLPNADILDRLDESMKVEGRYAVEPIEFYEDMHTWGQANNAWIKHALDLGEKALCRALQKAGLEPRDLSAIFVTSAASSKSILLSATIARRSARTGSNAAISPRTVVVHDPVQPDPAHFTHWAVRQDRGVFDRDAGLVIKAVGHPDLDRFASKPAGIHQQMKRMQMVIR